MSLYAGIDLHSNNNYVVVIDERDQVVWRRKQANEAGVVLRSLEPFRGQIAGVVVESTYNWYWLVDALQEEGWRVHLANTAAIVQYQGIKLTNDWSDAQWLAHLLRLGILREGYIYPKAERAWRDLLRKRSQLVNQRTRQMLSLENELTRQTGCRIRSHYVEQLTEEELERQFGQEAALVCRLKAGIRVMWSLSREIAALEKTLRSGLEGNPVYPRLRTVWGVGDILAQTILLETGALDRFASVGDYCSYSRMVSSSRWSNGKKKGENNTKCGNRCLAWAYGEAAVFASRYYEPARRFVERKSASGGRYLGLKALAHKLCRASYYVMREPVDFDPNRVFGSVSGSGRGNPECPLAKSQVS